jgi:hypothetical protein
MCIWCSYFFSFICDSGGLYLYCVFFCADNIFRFVFSSYYLKMLCAGVFFCFVVPAHLEEKVDRIGDVINGIALSSHMIWEAIPTVVVGINISPSEDSEKNAVLYDKLLDLLCIDTPIPTTDVFNDIGLCSAMTYEDIGNISFLELAGFLHTFLHLPQQHQEGRCARILLLCGF